MKKILIVAILFFTLTLTIGVEPSYSRLQTPTNDLCPLDIVLVLDGSESISLADFDIMRNFSLAFVNSLSINPEGTNIGLVQFASDVRIESQVTSSLATITSAINSMTQIGTNTNIASGLSTANNLLGSGRDEAPNVIIILTDGEANTGGDPVTVAENIKSNGTTIFTVGVGTGYNQQQIRKIASNPFSVFSYEIKKFGDLDTFKDRLRDNVCFCRNTSDKFIRSAIATGICLYQEDSQGSSGSYFVVADLSNPHIRLEMMYENDSVDSAGNPTNNRFKLKTVGHHAHDTLKARDTLKSSKYYAAINGVAFKHNYSESTPSSEASQSVLGIDHYIFGENGFAHSSHSGSLDFIDNPTSFFSYRPAAIHPLGFSGNPIADKTKIQQVIADTSTEFAIGYSGLIVDKGTVVSGVSTKGSYRTAVGVSANEKQVFLATGYYNALELASRLVELGAHQAVLLDGGGSSQFSSLSKTHGVSIDWHSPQAWFTWPLLFEARKVINGLIVYNDAEQTELLTNVGELAGVFQISPNVTALLPSGTFDNGIALSYIPQFAPISSNSNINIQANERSVPPFADISAYFEIHAVNPAGDSFQPKKSFQLSYTYQSDLESLEDKLALFFWDGNKWVDKTVTSDLQHNTIVAETDQMGSWAVLLKGEIRLPYPSEQIFLPVIIRNPNPLTTPASTPTTTPTPINIPTAIATHTPTQTPTTIPINTPTNTPTPTDTVACPTPEKPTLVSPAEGSTIISFPITFQWNSANHATGYRIHIISNRNNQITIGIISSPYIFNGSFNEGPYSWQIQGINREGDCDVDGPWSEFRTGIIETQ